MTWVAVAIAGSAIIGAVASNRGANKQIKANERAADRQQELIGPYTDAGVAGLGAAQDFVSNGARYSDTQAYKDINNSKAASGSFNSGGRDTALIDYYATNFRPQRLNELLAIPRMGANAAVGQATNEGNLISQSGQAAANGIYGVGNSIQSGVNSIGFLNAYRNQNPTVSLSGNSLTGATVAGSGGQTPQSFFGVNNSDIRLKTNINKVGKLNGNNIYTWEWNDTAIERGIDDPTIGVIAQEIDQEYVIEKDGYLMVDYDGLFGVKH